MEEIAEQRDLIQDGNCPLVIAGAVGLYAEAGNLD